MRALIVTQHFAPEVTAGRFRIESFVKVLVSRGHEVDVVCAVPNHPKGVVENGYRGKLRVRRRLAGANVTYVWLLVRPSKTFWSRIGTYGSFAAAASIAGAGLPRPDVILASSPPLPVGAAGLALSRRHRAPFVLDVRDVWPDSAVALGELTNRRAIRLAERLERALYAHADSVVTVNQAFADHIRSRASDPGKVHVVPNGTTRDWLEAGEADPERSLLDASEDVFVWAYAGNIGLAHGLETAVDAAAILGDGYRLLVIGEGPRRPELEQQAATLPPGRIDLRGLMPAEEAARHLRAADALLVSERQERTVASKLYDYCAVGRPVVAACRGELQRVVADAGVGLDVPHGDAVALAEAVRRLRDEPGLRLDLERRGREFARSHLREEQAERLGDLLEAAAERRPVAR